MLKDKFSFGNMLHVPHVFRVEHVALPVTAGRGSSPRTRCHNLKTHPRHSYTVFYEWIDYKYCQPSRFSNYKGAGERFGSSWILHALR